MGIVEYYAKYVENRQRRDYDDKVIFWRCKMFLRINYANMTPFVRWVVSLCTSLIFIWILKSYRVVLKIYDKSAFLFILLVYYLAYAFNPLWPGDFVWRRKSWPSNFPVASGHQAITWTNMNFCGIRPTEKSTWILKLTITKLFLNVHVWNYSHISQWGNELTRI